MTTVKNSLHKSMVGASRQKKSLSGAIKVAMITNSDNTDFWREVNQLCGLKKTDVTPAFIVSHANEKQLNTRKGTAREIWSDWMVKQIVRAYTLELAAAGLKHEAPKAQAQKLTAQESAPKSAAA